MPPLLRLFVGVSVLLSAEAARAAETGATDLAPAFVHLSPDAASALVPPGGPGWPQVQAAPFEPVQSNVVTVGASHATSWGRFSLKNSTDDVLERWVEVDLPTLDDVRFYDPSGAGGRRACGILHPAAERVLQRPACTFQVPLRAHETRQVHVSVASQLDLDFAVGRGRLTGCWRRTVASGGGARCRWASSRRWPS